jgi:hypothetical protein
MIITINGNPVSFQLEQERTVGDVLMSIDSWLDGQGLIMTKVDVDGQCVSEDIGPVNGKEIVSVGTLDIGAERVSRFRRQALSQSSDWLDGIARWTAGSAEESVGALKTEGDLIISTNSGFLNPEESSLLEFARTALSAASDTSEVGERAGLSSEISRIAALLSERLAELDDPRGQVLKASRELNAERESFLNIPVYLQTGREKEAMSAVSRFTDLFSKTLRMIPALNESGIDTLSLKIGDQSSTDFFNKLNETLIELMDAFSRKDTVLIGDLSEYEILPRLETMYSAFEKSIREAS